MADPQGRYSGAYLFAQALACANGHSHPDLYAQAVIDKLDELENPPEEPAPASDAPSAPDAAPEAPPASAPADPAPAAAPESAPEAAPAA